MLWGVGLRTGGRNGELDLGREDVAGLWLWGGRMQLWEKWLRVGGSYEGFRSEPPDLGWFVRVICHLLNSTPRSFLGRWVALPDADEGSTFDFLIRSVKAPYELGSERIRDEPAAVDADDCID